MTSRILFAESVPLDKSLPLPPPLPEEQTNERNVLHCRQLLEQGKLHQFYETVFRILGDIQEEKQETIPNEKKQVILWLVYYVIAAPLVELDTVDDVNWAYAKDSPDYDTKMRAINMIAFGYSLPDISMPAVQRKTIMDLNTRYYSYTLREFRSRYDHDAINTQRERERKGRDLMADELAFGLYNNKINAQFLRNTRIETVVSFTEPGFVMILLQYFPDKRTKILDYIKQAGYEGEEITRLITKAVGRNKQTEFLFPKQTKSKK